MDTVTIAVVTESWMGASEIIADLRNVSETLYYPMKLVGFRDHRRDLHLCPQEERRETCPHRLRASDPKYVDYEVHPLRVGMPTFGWTSPTPVFRST